MTLSRSRCLSLISSKAITSAMPSTPFSGVRISWLMLARNCDLSTLASLAWSRASTSSVMVWRRLLSFSSSLASRWLKLRARLRKSVSSASSATGLNLPLAATSPMARDSRVTGAVTRSESPRARKSARPDAPKKSARVSAAYLGNSEPRVGGSHGRDQRADGLPGHQNGRADGLVHAAGGAVSVGVAGDDVPVPVQQGGGDDRGRGGGREGSVVNCRTIALGQRRCGNLRHHRVQGGLRLTALLAGDRPLLQHEARARAQQHGHGRDQRHAGDTRLERRVASGLGRATRVVHRR